MAAPSPQNNAPVPVQGVGGAAITITNLTYTDELGKYKDDNDDSIPTDFMCKAFYEKDHHKYAMGVTSPAGFQGKSVAIVQLASPVLILIIDWTSARLLKQPQVPDPKTDDSNWELLDEHMETVNITVGPDGVTPLYRISGTYFYGHYAPNADLFKNVTFPRAPWLLELSGREVPASVLEKGISMTVNNTGQNLAKFVGG